MVRMLGYGLLAILVLIAAYLGLAPVPIEPVAWEAPANPGYSGPFARNERLKGLEFFAIGDNTGPEAIAIDSAGRLYAATHQGRIVRLAPDGSDPENWVETGGRPLGIVFDSAGNLLVADAFRGLLSIDPAGKISVLATEAGGKPILYANDLDVAADGRIYFSDASIKFGAKERGGTYEASLLDLMEHGPSGRLLVHDPASGRTEVLVEGLSFANGVAVSPDQRYVLVNETGAYRVMRHWLKGPNAGETEPLIEGLPAFPDNLKAGRDGRFWVALVSPRSPVLDGLAGQPALRKVVQRFPAFLRPKAQVYGHIVAIDGSGRVVMDLQDPDGAFPVNTSVLETDDYLYIGSLMAPVMARKSKADLGL